MAEALKEAGNKLFKEGRYQDAWSKYDEAAHLEPKVPVYLANRAACELKLEEFGSAVATTTQALELDDKLVKCYYRRAIAYGGTLQFNLAVRDFQRVVQLAPEFAEGRRRLQSAQSLARYTAFQTAIKTDDEPRVIDTIDLEALPVSDGERTNLDFDLDAIDSAAISRLVEHFKAGNPVSRRLAYEIVVRVARLLAEEPTVNGVPIPEGGEVTVCGDTHGQFYDVLHIFEQNGWPSAKHTYVFNGDFVDRGSWSTEVALLLYVLKLQNPSAVLLNRGNHETEKMNVTYGFSGECKAKYPRASKLFAAFSESFALLPLGCIIADAYLVVHGGLFSRDDVTLDEIRSIDRFAQAQPANEGLMMEMLWSDPQDTPGRSPSRRGIAHMFGPDVTAKFVKDNGLRAVIRSHEVRDNGYAVEHAGKLITVFSAPNYCDSVGNQGAYINIDKDLELRYKQFTASWHPKVPPMAYASGLMQ